MSKYWKSTTIGDISEVVTKGTTPTSVGFKFTESGVNFVKVETITPSGRFLPSKFGYIDEDCHQALKRSQLASGDILFSIAGALGRTARVIPEILPANTNQALAIIRLKPSHEVMPEFVLRALSSGMLLKQIEKQRGGVAQQNLSLAQVKDFQIPLPPLSEQKQIVAIVDQAFEGIDVAIAHTKKNLTNARELFESYLNAVFTQKGDGWVEKTLEHLCSITSKLVDPRQPEFIDLPHIGVGNMISLTGKLIEIKTAREEELKSGKFLFDETMVLYSKIRPYLRKACRPEFKGLCSADVYPLLPNDRQLNRDFLFHLLMSRSLTSYAIAGSDRAGMPKVNRDHLFRYRISIPSLPEQLNLAKKMDEVAAETQRLEIIYRRKLAALTELKQSILQKAFTGELTADTANQATNKAGETIAA